MIDRIARSDLPARKHEGHRPSVDDTSEWSFPASDPPATWTWDVDERPRVAAPTESVGEGSDDVARGQTEADS